MHKLSIEQAINIPIRGEKKQKATKKPLGKFG